MLYTVLIRQAYRRVLSIDSSLSRKQKNLHPVLSSKTSLFLACTKYLSNEVNPFHILSRDYRPISISTGELYLRWTIL